MKNKVEEICNQKIHIDVIGEHFMIKHELSPYFCRCIAQLLQD